MKIAMYIRYCTPDEITFHRDFFPDDLVLMETNLGKVIVPYQFFTSTAGSWRIVAWTVENDTILISINSNKNASKICVISYAPYAHDTRPVKFDSFETFDALRKDGLIVIN